MRGSLLRAKVHISENALPPMYCGNVIFQRFSLVCIPNERYLRIRDVETELQPANSGAGAYGLALTRGIRLNPALTIPCHYRIVV